MEDVMEKKSERLEVRLGYQEKQTFTEACENQGDTPSGAIRRFINGYVRRSDADVLSSAWRDAAKRRAWRPAAFLTIFVAIAAMFWGFSKRMPVETDDAIFSARDVDSDGVLTSTELEVPTNDDGEPHGVMRVLDIDGSGALNKDEFVSEGKMVFMLRSENNAPIKKEDMPVAMTVVEFKFSKDDTRLATYRGAIVEADKFDRLVVWKADGTNSIWSGNVGISSKEGALKLKYDTVTY